tara:strand:+ start:93 stop:323 length:231 start_codon:yes stop_codon:yes gene_type:complete
MKVKTDSQLDIKRVVVSFPYKDHYISLAKWGEEPWQNELIVFTQDHHQSLLTDIVSIEGIIRAAAFIDKLVKEPKA